MKRRTKTAAVLLLTVCLLLGLCACDQKNMTAQELQAVLPALVENSVILNELYFGRGFIPDGDVQKDSTIAGYYYVDCDYLGFYSITEIKEATEKVFTPEYAALLYASAFDGFATEDTVVSPRYTEGEMGLMQTIYSTVYDLPARVYDFSTLKIVKKGSTRATVRVETTANGETQMVELIVVRTYQAQDGTYEYRLDSPTY